MLLNAAIAASGRRVDCLHLPTLGTADDAFFAPLETTAGAGRERLSRRHPPSARCRRPAPSAESGAAASRGIRSRRAVRFWSRAGAARPPTDGGGQRPAAGHSRHHCARPPQRSRAAPSGRGIICRTIADAALIEAAQRIAPLVRACRDEGECERRLPAQVLAAMHEARLFRMYIPKGAGRPRNRPD